MLPSDSEPIVLSDSEDDESSCRPRQLPPAKRLCVSSIVDLTCGDDDDHGDDGPLVGPDVPVQVEVQVEAEAPVPFDNNEPEYVNHRQYDEEEEQEEDEEDDIAVIDYTAGDGAPAAYIFPASEDYHTSDNTGTLDYDGYGYKGASSPIVVFSPPSRSLSVATSACSSRQSLMQSSQQRVRGAPSTLQPVPPMNTHCTSMTAHMAVNIPHQIFGGTKPDLRNRFIYILMIEAQRIIQAQRPYTRDSYFTLIRAITNLSQYEHPLRTIDSCVHFVGECDTLVKKTLQAGADNNKSLRVPLGKFLCAAPAALAYLLEHSRQRIQVETMGNKEASWCMLEELIDRVNDMLFTPPGLRNRFNLESIDLYLRDSNVLSIAFDCLKELLKERIRSRLPKLVSIHSRKRNCPDTSGVMYELLSEGTKWAEKALAAAATDSADGPTRLLTATTTFEKYCGVVVAIDFREGGAGHEPNLHKICDELEHQRVPYFTRSLVVGDYLFYVNCATVCGMPCYKLAPIIVERKTIVDIAESIHGGRWVSQKARMRKAQYIMGRGQERMCELFYLIEGTFGKDIMVGEYVGKPEFRLRKEDILQRVDDLKDQGFHVIWTKASKAKTRAHLPDLSIADLAERVLRNHQLEIYNGHDLLTYDELKIQLDALPDIYGAPSLAPVDSTSAFRPSLEDGIHMSQDTFTQASNNSSTAVPRADLGSNNSIGNVQHQFHDNDNDDDYDDWEQYDAEAFEVSVPIAAPGAASSFSSSSSSSYQTGKNSHRRTQTTNELKNTDSDYSKPHEACKINELKNRCRYNGLITSGTKAELIARLHGPQPPLLLQERFRRDEYCPKMPSSNAAILIAMLLNDPGLKGLSKEDIKNHAHGLRIKNMYEMRGPHNSYSPMIGLCSRANGTLITSQFVVPVARKGEYYKLTSHIGVAVATAVHEWAHSWQLCRCNG